MILSNDKIIYKYSHNIKKTIQFSAIIFMLMINDDIYPTGNKKKRVEVKSNERLNCTPRHILN